MKKLTPIPFNRYDHHFFSMCSLVSQLSKDQSTKVGAVIAGPANEVRSTGFNSFPRGILDDISSRQERPQKYLFFEHAERNAIYNAARVGIPLEGCRLYVPWHPCADCARAIIQSGIKQVYLLDWLIPSHWTENCGAAHEMFSEAGVSIFIQGPDMEEDTAF